MDENVVFKTAAVGGFEKRAVLDYIYKMNEQTEEEQSKLHEQIAELGEKLQFTEENSRSTNNNLRTIERDMSTLSSELADEKSARLELVAKNEELKSEITYQKELVAKKELETDEFMRKNQSIIQQNQSLEEQQKEIDQASYQLGRVMLDARTDADNIVGNAKEQAEEIISQSRKDAEELKRKTSQETSGLLASTQEEIKSQLDAAHIQGERTKTEAEEIAKLTVNTAVDRSDSIMDDAREHVGAILETTEDVHDISNVQLRELRRETLAIRQAIQEAFNTLQEKAEVLDTYIENAQITIKDESAKVIAKKLEEIPNINLEEIRKAYASRNGNAALIDSAIVDASGNLHVKDTENSTVSTETVSTYGFVDFVPEAYPSSGDQVTTHEVESYPEEDEKITEEQIFESLIADTLGETEDFAYFEEFVVLEEQEKGHSQEQDQEQNQEQVQEQNQEQVQEQNQDQKETNQEDKHVGSESGLLSGENNGSFSSSMVRPSKKNSDDDNLELDFLLLDANQLENLDENSSPNETVFPPSLSDLSQDISKDEAKDEGSDPAKGGFF